MAGGVDKFPQVPSSVTNHVNAFPQVPSSVTNHVNAFPQVPSSDVTGKCCEKNRVGQNALHKTL